MPQKPPWNPEVVPNLMRQHGIGNIAKLSTELAKVYPVSRATVYRHFNPDWTGTATLDLLAAMSTRFNVPFDILTGNRRSARQSAEQRRG